MAKLGILAEESCDATADAAAHPARDCVSLVFIGDGLVRSAALREGDALRVGRQPPADILLSHATVSRQHARFFLKHGVLFVEDAGSHNGVFVNGTPTRHAAISSSDRVRIGAIDVVTLDASRVPERDARELSALRFVTRMAEELERTRYTRRAVWLCALRWPARVPSSDQIERATEALWPIDRFCSHAPHIVLAMLLERNQADARATAEAMQRRAEGVPQIALVSAPPLELNAEAMIARAIDLVHRRGSDELITLDPCAESGAEEPVRGAQTRRLFELAARTSHADLPLLVLGETGAGKEVIARVFHEHSQRARAPFCEVNCAAIAPTLVESILFGHERGAFTGADKRSAGLFEQAHGGTLFLDEVGELSQSVQGALLRCLESKRIRRVGATQEVDVDVRIIAATNRDLRDLVARGQFREDLLYRLEALTVRVPPLRERKDEVEPLARLFLERAAGKWGAPARTLAEPALRALAAYEWPGNIRELRNAIERAVAVCRDDVVTLDDLPEHLSTAPNAESDFPAPARVGSAYSLPDAVGQFEIARIRDALVRAGGNRAHAARLLGLPRRTLGNKIRVYGLE
jgi:two-component system response regulator AtoC